MAIQKHMKFRQLQLENRRLSRKIKILKKNFKEATEENEKLQEKLEQKFFKEYTECERCSAMDAKTSGSSEDHSFLNDLFIAENSLIAEFQRVNEMKYELEDAASRRHIDEVFVSTGDANLDTSYRNNEADSLEFMLSAKRRMLDFELKHVIDDAKLSGFSRDFLVELADRILSIREEICYADPEDLKKWLQKTPSTSAPNLKTGETEESNMDNASHQIAPSTSEFVSIREMHAVMAKEQAKESKRFIKKLQRKVGLKKSTERDEKTKRSQDHSSLVGSRFTKNFLFRELVRVSKLKYKIADATSNRNMEYPFRGSSIWGGSYGVREARTVAHLTKVRDRIMHSELQTFTNTAKSNGVTASFLCKIADRISEIREEIDYADKRDINVVENTLSGRYLMSRMWP